MSDNSTEYDGFIFTTTDPLGREVELKSSTWFEHIIGGAHHRAEFIGREEKVKRAIENPDYIIRSKQNGQRELYIDVPYFEIEDEIKIRPIMVVVDHSGGSGEVCTVMVQSRMRGNTEQGGIIYDRHEK